MEKAVGGPPGKGQPNAQAKGAAEKTVRERPGDGMARLTGREPATPGVTGRYSNQLNYHCTVVGDDDPNLSNWWVVTDSNRRHSACKADALPTELTTHRLWWVL